MKHVKFKADFSDWNLDSPKQLVPKIDRIFGRLDIELSELKEKINSDFEEIVLKTASEAMLYIFKDNETSLYFPAEWGPDDGIGGKAPKDPLTIYLHVGMSSGEPPTFAFNLREGLASAIEACSRDGSYSAGLKRIRNALRNFADDIDKALLKKAKP